MMTEATLHRDGNWSSSRLHTDANPTTLPDRLLRTVYDSLYLNNNGNLTMGQPLSQFTPRSLNQIDVPMIAPFWADVDTRIGPVVTYGNGSVNGHAAFGVNWLGVGCFNDISSVANYFQVLLINRSDLGPNAFDIEFNYGPITWDSGQASGGNGSASTGRLLGPATPAASASPMSFQGQALTGASSV